MLNRTLTAALAVALLAFQPLPASAQSSEADTKELASYRLTEEALHKFTVTMRTMAAEMKKNPAAKELAKIAAQIEALEAKAEITDAEAQQLEALEARQMQLEESIGGVDLADADSLDQMEAQLKASREASAALKAAGFPPREYAKFTLVLFQAAMVAGMKKTGLMKELPKDVSAENVRFIETHEKELEALKKEMDALSPRGGA